MTVEENTNVNYFTFYKTIYNWYAVDADEGLCPVGWHIPSDDEFKTLEMYLGMSESEVNSSSN